MNTEAMRIAAAERRKAYLEAMVEGLENKTKAWWTGAELKALVEATQATVSDDCRGLVYRGVLQRREGRHKAQNGVGRYRQKVVFYKLCALDKVAEESAVKLHGRPKTVGVGHAK
jgi:hypothetical protein